VANRPPDILQQMRQQLREERLQAEIDDLRFRLDQLTKGGRPGPNWEAYADLGQTLLDYGVPFPVARTVLNRLILSTEAVARQTVDKRVRAMLSAVQAQRKE
jgi:hypothetical protein